MALKFKLKSKDEIPEGLEAHYVGRDSVWILDTDCAVDKSKLDEFRNTNVALMRERDDLKKRFEGIDPDEFHRLVEEKRKLEEAQQVKAGEVDPASVEQLRRASNSKLDEFRSTNVALLKERDDLKNRFEGIDPDELRRLAEEKRKSSSPR